MHQQCRPIVWILGDKSVVWRVGGEDHVDVDGVAVVDGRLKCYDEACCAGCLSLQSELDGWMELDRPADGLTKGAALSQQSAVSRMIVML